MPPRRSQSAAKGRGASATPRRSTSRRRTPSRSPSTKGASQPRASAPRSPRASGKMSGRPSAQGSTRVSEMFEVEATLAGRRRALDGSRTVANRRGVWFWVAIIALEVLAFFWLRWTYEVYAEMRAKYSK